MADQKTVLLTNALQRKTLAVARSLATKGIKVISCDTTKITPTRFSKSCRTSLICPDPTEKPKDFYLWLVNVIKKYNCDMLFPMDDDAMTVVMDHYEELSGLCIIPIPPRERYIIAQDKASAVELAISSGVNCPHTIKIDDLEKLEEIEGDLKYPIVIKPRESSGSRGIKKVLNASEFKDAYERVHSKYPFPLVQEYIEPEARYDVCLLFDENSELKATFVQKELRQFPIEMGPSTVQESVLYPELVHKAVSIMKGLKWRGVAELEFIVDRKDGKIKFMEINPRFWASLHLAIISGVDFPYLLYRIGSEGTIEGIYNYKEGLRCRWLIPGDILHFLLSKDRWKMKPPFWHGSKHGVEDDIFSVRDPMPAIGAILAVIYYLPSVKMWRHMFFR